MIYDLFLLSSISIVLLLLLRVISIFLSVFSPQTSKLAFPNQLLRAPKSGFPSFPWYRAQKEVNTKQPLIPTRYVLNILGNFSWYPDQLAVFADIKF